MIGESSSVRGSETFQLLEPVDRDDHRKPLAVGRNVVVAAHVIAKGCLEELPRRHRSKLGLGFDPRLVEVLESPSFDQTMTCSVSRSLSAGFRGNGGG
jgi:hypothetical protein